jgi:eukaryotic-like serine/threonine-protein kinase
VIPVAVEKPSLDTIVCAAIEIASAEERATFLAQACGGDRELLERAERLVNAHLRAGSFLESPAAAAPLSPKGAGAEVRGTLTIDQPVTEALGMVIGPYKLVEQIGEGGMGTVWMAQQTEPVKRLVALKLIKAGMDSKQVITRFEAERQALALMDHPNIARVLDGGTTKGEPGGVSPGRPYFVMDLVKGVPITRYCDEHHLTPRQRLELFLPVCQAVQHAHQKGIIHRDLKPSNVLVALYDGKPVPKVIDFGVAKAAGQSLTDKTLVTGFGAIVGTLEYMSPEQAEINQLDIDTRSDIYSLGVLLYELLTGSPPFSRKELEKAGMLEMLRVIREQEPSKPSTKLSTAEGLPTLAANRGTEPAKLTKLVRGELDWIVMKALEKDRGRRYETANGFAMDVQRYLADETVLACPPSVGYRLRKYARRNKVGLAVAGLVLFFLILLGSGVGWALRDRQAREQEIALETARKLALTEEGIRQALDRGTKSRAELHALLRKPGGVQQLLNQPARWELFIKTAQGELAQARGLAVRAEGSLDVEWTQAMDQLERQLTSDQADYDLARDLEKIRLDKATWVEGRFDERKAADEYAKAFARFAVLSDDPAAVAARLASSPIKEQLVAALDDWAVVAYYLSREALAEPLLALARQAAPDPVWGDRLRQLKVWRDQVALGKLVAQAPAARLSPQLLHLVGRLLHVDNTLKESWLRQAQAAHPADFWLNFDLAVTLVKTNPVEAAAFDRVALAVRPGNSASYNNLGVDLAAQGKKDEAIAAYRKGIEINPKHASLYYNLGNALSYQKKLDEAISAYRRAIELNPKDAWAHTALGNALRDQNKLDEAIDCFQKAIELDSKYSGAYHGLGNALYRQTKLPEAIAAYRKAIELDPKSADAHTNLGNALQDQKKLDEAIACYKKAIELDPKDAIPHNNLGGALLGQKKLDDAIAAYRKAIELDSKHAYAHRGVGDVLKAQGKLDDAIAAYRRSIELDPNFARAYRDLGHALNSKGKVDDAITAYRKAIELDPINTNAHDNLGHILETQGKLDDAIACYRRSIELNPKSAWPRNALGSALGKKGWDLANHLDPKLRDPKRAVELGKEAVELAPQSAMAWQYLGWVQYRAGNWKASIEALEKSCELEKGGDCGQWIVMCLAHWKWANEKELPEQERGRHQAEARRCYERAIQQIDGHPGLNDSVGQAIRAFRAEAGKLLDVKDKQK